MPVPADVARCEGKLMHNRSTLVPKCIGCERLVVFDDLVRPCIAPEIAPDERGVMQCPNEMPRRIRMRGEA